MDPTTLATQAAVVPQSFWMALLPYIIQCLIGVPTLIYAVTSYLKSRTNGQKLDENTNLTRDVHVATNGKMDMMIQAVQAATAAAQAAANHAQTIATMAQAQSNTPASITVTQNVPTIPPEKTT